MKSIDVAVGIILDSSKTKVLVAQRNTEDIHYGKWEFPGGKVSVGESTDNALKRELREELDIVISSSQPFTSLNYQYPDRNVNLNFNLVTTFSGDPIGKEGQMIKWIKIKKLAVLDMLEANKDIIRKLQENFDS